MAGRYSCTAGCLTSRDQPGAFHDRTKRVAFDIVYVRDIDCICTCTRFNGKR